MKNYHDFYLNCNVLLLDDVFEKFRNSSLKHYGLCLSHYFSAQALNCDAMVNITTIELEVISEGDMLLVFEKSMRGGIIKFLNNIIKPAKVI